MSTLTWTLIVAGALVVVVTAMGPPWRVGVDVWMQRMMKLFHLRMAFAFALLGAIVGAPLSFIWPPLGVVAMAVVFLGGMFLYVFDGEAFFRCPYCDKRVSPSASVCHRCGRTMAY